MSFYDEENEGEKIPSLFAIYDDEEARCNATINYHRQIFDQKDPEDPLKKIYLFDLSIPNDENQKLPIKKVSYEEEPRKHLPKWIRKEMKRDNRDWRRIHQTLKQTTKYAPEYFSPLPEVEPAVLKYTQVDLDSTPKEQ